jgi:hypothetical protein
VSNFCDDDAAAAAATFDVTELTGSGQRLAGYESSQRKVNFRR